MSSDLVSREALIKKIFPYGMPDDGNYPINAKAIMKAIEGLKPVDAVPVVRCKDCKYYVTAPSYALDCDDPKDTKICRNPNMDYDTECGDQWIWMNPDDFCSDGERK